MNKIKWRYDSEQIERKPIKYAIEKSGQVVLTTSYADHYKTVIVPLIQQFPSMNFYKGHWRFSKGILNDVESFIKGLGYALEKLTKEERVAAEEDRKNHKLSAADNIHFNAKRNGDTYRFIPKGKYSQKVLSTLAGMLDIGMPRKERGVPGYVFQEKHAKMLTRLLRQFGHTVNGITTIQYDAKRLFLEARKLFRQAERSLDTSGKYSERDQDRWFIGDAPYSLPEYQIEMVDFLLSSPFRYCGDQQGLGKTVEIGTAMFFLTKVDPTVFFPIACPVNVFAVWGSHMRKFGITNWVATSWHHDAICTFDPLTRVLEQKQAGKLKLDGPIIPIFDEAHYAANAVKRSRAAIKLGAAADGAFLASGTPVRNLSAAELFNAFLIMREPFCSLGRYDFENMFSVVETGNRAGGKGKYRKVKGVRNIGELHEMRERHMLRRLAKDIPGMPKILRTMFNVTLSREELAYYNATVEDYRREYARRVAEGKVHEAGWRLAEISKIRQASSLVKSRPAAEIAIGLLKEKERVVVFLEFHASIEKFMDTVRQQSPETKLFLIDGSVSGPKRGEIVDEYNATSNAILVGSYAMKEGISCNTTEYAIIVGRPWTWSDTNQAEHRGIRMTSDYDTVFLLWMVIPGPDERVESAVQAKHDFAAAIIEGVDVDGIESLTANAFTQENMLDVYSTVILNGNGE